jgi:Delta14-sterol reductase
LPPLIASYCFGFWLFRGTNGQKHRFKETPGAPIWGRAPRVLGGRLLVSGFWGIGRKLNYTGELMMYLSWTLLSGFQSWVPYLLPAWLLGLLAQRAARDDRRCHAKYGALWDEYCRHARFRMFPFLY